MRCPTIMSHSPLTISEVCTSSDQTESISAPVPTYIGDGHFNDITGDITEAEVK